LQKQEKYTLIGAIGDSKESPRAAQKTAAQSRFFAFFIGFVLKIAICEYTFGEG